MFLHGHSIISETIGETQGKTAHKTGKDALQCEGPLPGEGTKKTNGTSEKQEKTLSSLVSTRNLQDVPSSTSSYALSREPETSSDDHIGGVIDLRFNATPISNESEVSGTNGDTFEKQRTDGLQVITVFLILCRRKIRIPIMLYDDFSTKKVKDILQ